MHPNPNSVGVTIPQAQQSTMIMPSKSKEEERLAKTIKYFSSKMFLVQLILAIVFSVPEITFGHLYNGQCPVSPNIPLFLLVHGSTKIVWVACGIIARIEAGFFPHLFCIRILMLINVIIQKIFLVFLVIWFIIGNVWFWSVKGNVQTTDSTIPFTYCYSALYDAAHDLIILTYIFSVITVISTIKRRLIGRKLLRIFHNQ